MQNCVRFRLRHVAIQNVAGHEIVLELSFPRSHTKIDVVCCAACRETDGKATSDAYTLAKAAIIDGVKDIGPPSG